MLFTWHERTGNHLKDKGIADEIKVVCYVLFSEMIFSNCVGAWNVNYRIKF